jgi:hypothetical protein
MPFVFPSCWLCGATQQAPGYDHSDTAPAGYGRRGNEDGNPLLELGRLLGRVFELDMATCPLCRRGSLRIIAAITQESVITRILRHLKLASVPPPIAPARCRQKIFAFD